MGDGIITTLIICAVAININTMSQAGELLSFVWKCYGPDPDDWGKVKYWSAKVTFLCPKCAAGFWTALFFCIQGQFAEAFMFCNIAILINTIYEKTISR